MAEPLQFPAAGMKNMFSHLRHSQGGIIDRSNLMGRLQFFGAIEPGVQDMNLSIGRQLLQGPLQRFTQRREILEGRCKYNNIKSKLLQDIGPEIPIHELQVGLVSKDPGRLLQPDEIQIETDDPAAGHHRQLRRQPAIAATDLQYADFLFLKGQIPRKPAAGPPADKPFPVMGMPFSNIRQHPHLLIGIGPVLPVATAGILLLQQPVRPGQSRDIYIIRLISVLQVHEMMTYLQYEQTDRKDAFRYRKDIFGNTCQNYFYNKFLFNLEYTKGPGRASSKGQLLALCRRCANF